MSSAELMWECACGHTEYSSVEPEECIKCGNLSNFMQMPEEIVDEREKEMSEEAMQAPIKKAKSSAKKIKAKSTKSKRSKK
ncbi:MAG: hypothetical protein WCK29_00145 [archaeon]